MTGAAGSTVLVVDDTISKRYVLASWLRRGGYQVLEAGTGGEALAVVAQGGVDLVVLDVRLPDLSGFDVCEQIKADPVHGATPVVHVSAAAIHAVDRTHGLERGADAYLVEPIDPNELLATVAAVLRYYQARIRAEQLAGRLAELARVAVAVSSAASQTQLLELAAAGAAGILDGPTVVIATGADGSRLAAVAAGPGAPVALRSWTVPVQEEPVGVRVTERSAEGWPRASWPGPRIRVLSARSRADRPPVYVLAPGGAQGDGDGTPVLVLFGQALLTALDSLRQREEEHDFALTLQRSLLPRNLPYVPGIDVAVRYVPAGEVAEIGGDFYEVIQFGDRLVIAVGDVGGHSLHAATVMAELRHATRAYLTEGHGPAAVLDRLNTLIMTLLPGEIATMCLLSLDIASGAVTLANAGHPPPLHCAGGRTELIEGRSPLLGIPVRKAGELELRLGVGETLLLYTDGLVERRSEPLDDGLARLCRAAQSVEGDLEAFASRLVAQVGPAQPADDIALVALRRRSGRG